MLVSDLLRRAAEDVPDRVAAILDGVGQMTYAEWYQRSSAVARGLAARGITAGDRVALLYDNAAWLDYGIGYFATLFAGGVAVPVSPRLSAAEVRHIVEHAEARGMLVQPAHAVLAEQALPESGPWIETDTLGVSAVHSSDPFQVPRTESDLAEIIYTSGTTGLPKGVATPHGNIASGRVAAGLMPGETLLHAIPLSTFAGTFAMMVAPVGSRWTNVVMQRFDPERYCALIAVHGVTTTYLVPAMAKLLVDSGAGARHDVSSVQRVWFGSAPMLPGTLHRLAMAFPSASLVNIYGATEAGGAGTAMAYDPQHPDSVGRPVGDSRIRVVDDKGENVAPGTVGEIWIGLAPRVLSRGYYRDPEATEQTVRDGWVRTGDLGYIDGDGYLFVVDRIKDVIIRGGYKVASAEVEDVLENHETVAEAAVVGIPHEVLGEDVAAVVVRRPGRTISAAELQAHCRLSLADYKVPRRIDFVDQLPRNPLGKVLKRELRATLASTVGG